MYFYQVHETLYHVHHNEIFEKVEVIHDVQTSKQIAAVSLSGLKINKMMQHGL